MVPAEWLKFDDAWHVCHCSWRGAGRNIDAYPVRTGQLPSKRLATVMEFILLLAFAALLTLFSLLGWTADTRDGADWAPTTNGMRAPARR